MNNLSKYSLRGTFKQELQLGEQYANFKVETIFKSRDYQCLAYKLRHLKTNAIYHHFATNQIVNQGAFLFKTPSRDSGVGQVLQQILNSGSKQYPVRDAWIHMCGRSLQGEDLAPFITPEYMAFQFSSPLQDDFQSLLQLSLEQIFNPLFKEVDFLQQIRIQKVGNELFLRGNAFDECKKYYGQPDFVFQEQLQRYLLNYQNGGGTLQGLADLTYQECKEYYDRYIATDNMYIVSAGDLSLLAHCQYLDKVLPTKIRNFKESISLPELKDRLNLKGSEYFGYVFRTTDIQCGDYLKLGVLGSLLNNSEELREEYQNYQIECDTSLRYQLFSIGYPLNKESSGQLYSLMNKIKKDVYSLFNSSMIERMKLNRELRIQDIYQFVINDVDLKVYLEQNVEDLQGIVDKYLCDSKKTIVNVEQDEYFMDDLELKMKQHLGNKVIEAKRLADEQTMIDEDTAVLSLDSLPKLHALDIIPLLKEDLIDKGYYLPKYPQQCDLEIIISIQDYSKYDVESIYLLRDVLQSMFDYHNTSFQMQSYFKNETLVFQISCLNKSINELFKEIQMLTDPALDDLEQLSQILSVISALYVDQDDITKTAINYCEQHKYTQLELIRKVCTQQVELLRNYTSKNMIKSFSNRLIDIFYKIMNVNRLQFKGYVNPLLHKQLHNQVNLIKTNLNLQFEDYQMNILEFNEKYQIQGYERQFQFIKQFICIPKQTNMVLESFQIESNQIQYKLLAIILTQQFLPQYCTTQSAYCVYCDGRLTFYTANDVQTLKSYRIFENAVHLLKECMDQDCLNSAKLRAFTMDPEEMTRVLGVSLEQILEAAEIILKKMAEGESAQCIFGQQSNYDEFVKKGWVIERYVNEVSV